MIEEVGRRSVMERQTDCVVPRKDVVLCAEEKGSVSSIL